jgi:hypothetical protein
MARHAPEPVAGIDRNTQAAGKTAEPAFTQVWDNDDDAEYDRL